MPRLVVEKGGDKGKAIAVVAGPVVVGRDTSAGISINDTMASRNHFKIEARNGGYYLVDLNSKNGTLLNGSRVKDSRIQVGDRVQVGETVFSFMEDSKPKEDLVGRIVGRRYKVIERVGRGGMGTVYKAEQIRLNRLVALKMLQQELVGDPAFIKRFMDEARAAAQFNHPNVVTVYEIDVDNEMTPSVPFIAMEYLPGGSVQDMLSREKKLSPERALAVILDAARGLEYAEKKQIVHRDIKPDNLMVSEDGRIKIGDLGLAKQMKGEGTKQEEGVFGTPHFIAPEQALNKQIDIRADIYALGATFYRILSGTTPYQGMSAKEIIVNKLKGPPPPLESIDPGIPRSLCLIVDKMMKNVPDERHATAKELVQELDKARREFAGSMTGPLSLDPGPAGSSATASAIGGESPRTAAPVIVLTSAAVLLLLTTAVVVIVMKARQGGGDPVVNPTPPPVISGDGDRDKLGELARKAWILAEQQEKSIDPGDKVAIRALLEAFNQLIAEYPGTDAETQARKQIEFWNNQIVRLDSDELWSKAEGAKGRFDGKRREYATDEKLFDAVVAEANSAMQLYGDFSKDFPEDPRSSDAGERLAAIDKSLETLRRRQIVWTEFQKSASELVERFEFGNADRKYQLALKDPEYEDFAARLREGRMKMIEKAKSALTALSERLATRRDAHDFEGARKLLEEGRLWGYDEFSAEFTTLSASIDTAEREQKDREVAKVRAAHEAAIREARLRGIDAARHKLDFQSGALLMATAKTVATEPELIKQADDWIELFNLAAAGHKALIQRLDRGLGEHVKIEFKKIKGAGRPAKCNTDMVRIEMVKGATVDLQWKDVEQSEYRALVRAADPDWTTLAGLIACDLCLSLPHDAETDISSVDKLPEGKGEPGKRLRAIVAALKSTMHESEASDRLEQARAEVQRSNWQRALDDLNEISIRLNATKFYADHRSEIDTLQDGCKDKIKK